MDSGCLAVVLFLAAAAGFIALFAWLLVRSNKQDRELFGRFVASLSSESTPEQSGAIAHSVIHRGRTFRVSLSPSGKIRYIHLELQVASGNLEFSLIPQIASFDSKIAAFEGRRDILLNDEEFDRLYLIHSNDPQAPAQILGAELRRDLLKLREGSDSSCKWEISNGRIHHLRHGLLGVTNDPLFTERFRFAIDVAASLADRIERKA